MKNLLTLTALVLFGLTTVSIQADTILINFNGNTTTNVITGSPTWNNILGQAGTTSNLLDVSNTATNIGVTLPSGSTGNAGPYEFPSGGFTFAGGQSNGTGTVASEFYPQAAGGLVYVNGTSLNITLTGLDNSGATDYAFTFVSSHNSTAVFTYSISGATVTPPTQSFTDSGTLTSANFVTFTNIIPTSTTLTLTITGSVGTSNSYLHALQIDTAAVAPEPSTIALAIIGGLGLFFVALRRRQQAQI